MKGIMKKDHSIGWLVTLAAALVLGVIGIIALYARFALVLLLIAAAASHEALLRLKPGSSRAPVRGNDNGEPGRVLPASATPVKLSRTR